MAVLGRAGGHPVTDVEWPDQVEVGRITYTIRRYTPRGRGQTAGHGWVRSVGDHRAEARAEVVALVDEVVRLRARAFPELRTSTRELVDWSDVHAMAEVLWELVDDYDPLAPALRAILRHGVDR